MKDSPKLEVIMLSLDQVKPYEKNPRHNEEAVDALKKSILKYGFNQPIVVDTEYVIVKGHTRYKAVTELDLTEIPVIISQNSEKVNRVDRIADNKIHDLTKWDKDALSMEVRDIEDTLSEVLGDFNEEDYSDVDEVDEISMDDVGSARQKMVDGANRQMELIKVTCECGYEMFLSKTSIENLK